MQTAMPDTCEALLAMLDATLVTDETIRVDVFDEWHNPAASQGTCWTWTRTCSNKADVTDMTGLILSAA